MMNNEWYEARYMASGNIRDNISGLNLDGRIAWDFTHNVALHLWLRQVADRAVRISTNKRLKD